MKKFLFGISLSLLATSALAADLAPRSIEPAAPMTAPAFVWTGFYVGAQAGYLWGDSKLRFPNTADSAKLDPKGALIGGQAGYNYQFDNGVVVGGEADLDWSSAKHTTRVEFPDGTPTDSERAKGTLDWTGSLRARVGYGFDRFLPYVSGGVAFGDYKHTLTDEGISNSKSDTRAGWTIGAGLDYAITDHWVAGVEYRYTDYGKKSYHDDEVGTWDRHDVDLSTNDVRLKASYKF